MNRRAARAIYPIPDDLRVMGGDDFIFYVNLGVGHEEHVIPSITMTHVERGTYDKSPEIWALAKEDTRRWDQHGLTKLVPRRIQKCLGCTTARSLHRRLSAIRAIHLKDCSVCASDVSCTAWGGGNATGHACNCPEEGGGQGYRLRQLVEIAHRKALLERTARPLTPILRVPRSEGSRGCRRG